MKGWWTFWGRDTALSKRHCWERQSRGKSAVGSLVSVCVCRGRVVKRQTLERKGSRRIQ